jgi:hypothetical protein
LSTKDACSGGNASGGSGGNASGGSGGNANSGSAGNSGGSGGNSSSGGQTSKPAESNAQGCACELGGQSSNGFTILLVFGALLAFRGRRLLRRKR